VSKARLVITAVVVEGRPVREVSTAYGVARSWIYELLVRYRAEGDAAFEPRSRRPHSQPTALPASTIELIIKLRRELTGQGLDAGPHTIAWHLAEQHQLQVLVASIWRALKRAGLITAEPKKKPRAAYVRFAAEQPNQMWQTDFTHYRLTRSDGGAPGADVEILTFLDDHSRYALTITCHRRVTGPAVVAAFQKTCADQGFPSRCCRTTEWCSPPDTPADQPAETPSTASKPNCAGSGSSRNTPSRTTPPPAAKSNDSNKH
jgi:transposase